MERDEGVFKRLDEQASTILREIDEELLKEHSQTDKALMMTMQTVVSSLQTFADWNRKLTKHIADLYGLFANFLTTMDKMIDRVSELDDLKPELDRMRAELEEQKPTVDEIRKAIERTKKVLNENK